jgi:carbon-monoxide dehydrogenase medium subunit
MAGNVCNASPAADTAVALLALDASVRIAGPSGRRTLPIAKLFLGPGKSALGPGEIVTSFLLPAASADLRGRYLRLSRRHGMDLATVGVLVALPGSSGGGHRVALAAVYPTPLRVTAAEALLDGGGSPEEAAELARSAARPITDLRGTAEYRREMVGVLVERGLVELRRAS